MNGSLGSEEASSDFEKLLASVLLYRAAARGDKTMCAVVFHACIDAAVAAPGVDTVSTIFFHSCTHADDEKLSMLCNRKHLLSRCSCAGGCCQGAASAG